MLCIKTTIDVHTELAGMKKRGVKQNEALSWISPPLLLQHQDKRGGKDLRQHRQNLLERNNIDMVSSLIFL
jgi:hypothetical protein